MYRGDIMLNEERVKHMVKLSFYETKGGSEEIKISSYLKRTYLRLNMLWSILCVTAAYAILVALIGMAFMQGICEPPLHHGTHTGAAIGASACFKRSRCVGHCADRYGENLCFFITFTRAFDRAKR